MRKKTIAIVSLAVIAGMCWTLMLFSSAVFIGGKALTWAVKSTGPVLIQSDNLESVPGVRVLDANNPFFKVTRSPKRIGIKWAKTNIYLEDAKYRAKQLVGANIRVMGRLNGNKAYPVVIDTGNPTALVVTDTVVSDCGLEIYPMEELGPPLGGLCHVARIEIGDMTITNPQCYYMLSHYERRVLGRTIWKQRDIFLGLVLIRKFVYVLIDNITGEVEFCVKGSFEADPKELWSQYSMSIETDDQNQERLMVDIPIAGQSRHIMLDTGSDSGMTLTENTWAKISPGLQLRREEKDQLATMFSGWLPCKKITVEQLTVGNVSISDAQIHVTADDTSYGQDNFTLGMDFFRDTVIVLDFERGLMWVKNPQSR